MARTPATFLLLLLLLVSSGLHVSCGCPDSCACRGPPLLNCSSAGLTSAPRPIRASVAQLDLSHNLLRAVAFDGPRPNLRDLWLGDNGIERLSLCVGGETGRTRRGRACESWAPALQRLSAERNRLQALPQGLESSRSLQVLQLSYNRISALRPGDLRHLQQLEELHLHHNLIRSLHPQTFQGLTRLRVLDLSFNMLTSLHPSTYLSLRHVGAEVTLGGNRWRCDCGARGLRRRMSYDGSRGLRAWSLVCASPAALAGRDLLRLEDHDLDCSGADGGAELHRDVTVRRGSEILLTCARQDLSWWTPSGEASVSQPQAGLLISDFQETDTGLYVCVSEKLEVVSVFDLQISEVGESRRKARSLPGISRQMIPRETPDSSDRGRNQLIRATQSELDLAVCLSVFITFVVSFVLGVLARPCVDVLLRRFTREKSSATTSVSAVEQRQYDNEAFCHSEEPVFTGPHRERRVTFSTIDLTEEGHVKYYDTVNAGNQERVNDDAVIECEPAEAERDTNAAGGSGSKISVRESSAEESQRDLSGRTHEKEFEHIPDSVERRGSVSSRSDSSRSDKVVNSTQTSRKREEDSVQQRADYSTAAEEDVVHISLEGPGGLPGFPTEPFADWSPHAKDTNLSDPGLWQENEEQFEFSDSAQSTSARSSTVRGSFNDSRLVSTLNKQKWVDSSNSSSNVSEDERTQNTMNIVAEGLERNLRKDGNFEQRILDDDAIGPSVQFNQGDYRPAVRPGESFSSFSSDGKGFTVKKGRVPSLVATSHGESLNTSAESSSPAAHRSSSSSESDAEHKHDLKKPIKRRAPQPPTHSDSRVEGENKTTNHMQKQGETSAKGLQIGVSLTGRHDPDTRWPVLDLEHIPHIKRRLDIKGPSHDPSSIKTGDETTRYTKRPVKMKTAGPPVLVSQTGSHNPDSRWPVLDLGHIPHIKRSLDIKGPSPDSSSSSDSEDETTRYTEKPGNVGVVGPSVLVSQTGSHNADSRWPVLDLGAITRIKRRLDIKGPSPDSTSSSDSEDETTRYTERPGNVEIVGPSVLVSQTGSHNADSRWPVLDLEQIPHIKRRLDIKGPSPDSSSSSHSDQIKKPAEGNLSMAKLPSEVSQTVSYDQQTKWPVLDLGATTRIKRRLDIKGPSPDSSSSSDSDQIKKPAQGNLSMPKLPSEVSQTVSYDQQTKWPVLDLGATTRIKRRLDIKGPSPDSTSSSDSEDETTRYTQRPGNVGIVGPSVLVSQTGSHNADSRWPVLDLEQIPHIKRRLDIKGPSPDSSSSSDSEDETTRYTEKPGNVEIVGPSVLVSQTGSHNADSRWPVLDLEQIPHIKRRLDIKGPSPDSSSSSHSDQIKKPAEGNLSMAKLPSEVSQTVSYDQQTKWPVLDLGATTRIKRRLDIKGPSPDSSSSSDSEDETTRYTEKPGNVEIVGPSVLVSQTGSHNADSRWPVLDLEHIPHIKRRLDIKGPSPDSSSSSDSDQIKKPAQGNLSMAKLPSEVSQTVSYDQQTKWPVLDLGATTRIKRRLDIKGPSPDSTSSSDSEDETTRYTQRPGNVEIVGPSVLVSQTGSHNADSRWPVLDLEHIPHIKRRLDIKGPSPDSSSSSDSDQIKKPAQGNLSMAKLPSEVSQTVSYDQQTKWPVLDLGATTRIKRRLDIKGPSPDSCSSSESEDETTRYTERPGKMEIAGPTSYTGRHDPDTRWPVLDLEASLRIKRRLDIKPRSPTPDSLSSGGGMNKMSSRRSSSSSDEQEGNVKNVRYRQTTVDPDGRWPDPELRSVFHVKKRLDIKARSPPPPESSSSSDHESEARSTNVEKQRTDVGITGYQSDRLSGTKKRLNIKGPSQPMDSESISSGEDENAKGLELSSVLKATKKEFTISPNTQVISTSRSPKTDNSIQLEKYTVITEEVGDKTSVNISATPEINPELQSRWATMNLGVSRFRKRLDITANTREPPSLSLLAPPDSPSSSSSGTESTSNRTQGNGKGAGVQGIIYKESTIIPEDKPGKVSLGLKGRDHSGDAVQGTEKSTKDYNRPTTERKPDTLLTGFSIPHVKRYLDIKVNEKVPPLEHLPDSFSSSSENEDASTKPVGEGWRKEASQHPTSLYSTQAVTVKPSQTELGWRKDEAELDRKLDSVRPELSLANIPRVRRALDIRAQRESRSSETTSLSVPNLSLGVPRVKRRLNVKGPLPSSSSESESDTNQSRSASNMSGMTDNDSLIAYKRVIMKTSPLPGWSSSQSGQRETERVEQESPSFAPKRVPRVGFDNVVDGRTGRPIGGADIPTEIRWTSIGRQMSDLSVQSPTGRSSPVARDVSLSPGGGFEKLDAPKARNERRGLGALKAMSSDRRKWDATEGNWASVAAPQSDDTRFENHRSAGEVESSTSRETDLLYGIPRYRRHDLGGTGPPREAPPLIPTTQSLP